MYVKKCLGKKNTIQTPPGPLEAKCIYFKSQTTYKIITKLVSPGIFGHNLATGGKENFLIITAFGFLISPDWQISPWLLQGDNDRLKCLFSHYLWIIPGHTDELSGYIIPFSFPKCP